MNRSLNNYQIKFGLPLFWCREDDSKISLPDNLDWTQLTLLDIPVCLCSSSRGEGGTLLFESYYCVELTRGMSVSLFCLRVLLFFGLAKKVSTMGHPPHSD